MHDPYFILHAGGCRVFDASTDCLLGGVKRNGKLYSARDVTPRIRQALVAARAHMNRFDQRKEPADA